MLLPCTATLVLIPGWMYFYPCVDSLYCYPPAASLYCYPPADSRMDVLLPSCVETLYVYPHAASLYCYPRADSRMDVLLPSYFYPRADSLPDGVRVVTCVGRAVEGKACTVSAVKELAAEGLDALSPYLAYSAYVANCGQGDVMGDGVVPIETSLLPGALHATLGDVWHTPQQDSSGRRWYGSPEVVAYWERFLK
eukprot:gene3025-13049_t